MSHDFDTGLKWYTLFILSVTAHEAAHAWMARRLGDRTAAAGGLVSLNPWPHVRRSPVGMVAVPLLSWLISGYVIGWASIPLDPEWVRAHPRKAAWVALAGPVTNLLIVVASLVVLAVGIHDGWLRFNAHAGLANAIQGTSAGGDWSFVAAGFLGITLSLNLLLAVFNLLPLPPFDGSALPPLVLPASAASRYAAFIREPHLAWVGLYIGWKIAGPLFSWVAAALVGSIGRAL